MRIAEDVLVGTIFVSWHYGSAILVGEGKLVNLVMNPVYGLHYKQPEYKFTAVRIKKVV